DSFLVLTAVRSGRGVGRDIAAATGLSIQKVGALLSRLSQAKAITRDGSGRWADLTAPVAKAAKPAPKPRRTPEVADRMAGAVREEQQQIGDQAAQNTAADFSRIMENSRRLNGIIGETLKLIQEIHAFNEDLVAEWCQLQGNTPAFEKAS
ncbi:hypothetical protein GGI1_23841, partial [Acidithiobacillus sp. GGI-221]